MARLVSLEITSIKLIPTLFFSKLQHTNNYVLCTIIYLPMVQYEMFGLATNYGLKCCTGKMSSVRDAVWNCFVQKVQF